VGEEDEDEEDEEDEEEADCAMGTCTSSFNIVYTSGLTWKYKSVTLRHELKEQMMDVTLRG